MNRINTLFKEKKNNILSVYFTAGYPELNDTCKIIKTLEKEGVDLIEIGIPFSDPLADGPVIQQSGGKALDNGMTLRLLFEQLEEIRRSVNIPLILMGYLNPVLQYGIENFCKKASEIGVDGLILPNLPLADYQENHREIFEKYDLKNIFLVTPQTSNERIKLIDSISSGFIYLVSSASVTGSKSNVSAAQIEYFKRIEEMQLKNSKLIGFGISDKKTFKSACSHAEGAIIGSAFIKAISEKGDLETQIKNFVTQIR